MLQACLNGDRLPGDARTLPLTAKALAEDFAACRAAGADEAHFHPRSPDGLETLDAGPVAEAIAACRAVGAPFGLSTRAGMPGVRSVLGKLKRWEVWPDYCSVNLHEAEAAEIRALLEARGVGVEAGVWTLADVARLKDGPRPMRILIEVMTEEPSAALDEADAILAALDRVDMTTPRLLHGQGGSAWPLLRHAQYRGLSTRVGFEDMLTDESGTRVAGNPALVTEALRRA